ncbi:2-oxoglutarate-dependent dioxygenase 19 [Linum grandiflorum]
MEPQSDHQPPKSIKTILSQSKTLTKIPLSYIFPQSPSTKPTTKIPTINYSHLTSTNPAIRSRTVTELGSACREWGFFVVTNHGVPTEAMLEAARQFFEMDEEDKDEYRNGTKGVLEPIRCGTSFNSAAEKVFCWKDFLKVFVHPEFHSPSKPPVSAITYLQNYVTCFTSKVLEEYSSKAREVAKQLLRGISESLGLQPDYISQQLDLEENMFQFLAANFYPPCPQPELAMGMAPHSDHCLITLLIQNNIDGLQIHHEGHWVDIGNVIPGAFLVNIADQLEILSNGKYKSILHRATVNKEATRISLALANAPSLDSVVAPAPELLERDGTPAAFKGMKYRDYLSAHQSKQLDGKSSLETVRA